MGNDLCVCQTGGGLRRKKKKVKKKIINVSSGNWEVLAVLAAEPQNGWNFLVPGKFNPEV